MLVNECYFIHIKQTFRYFRFKNNFPTTQSKCASVFLPSNIYKHVYQTKK